MLLYVIILSHNYYRLCLVCNSRSDMFCTAIVFNLPHVDPTVRPWTHCGRPGASRDTLRGFGASEDSSWVKDGKNMTWITRRVGMERVGVSNSRLGTYDQHRGLPVILSLAMMKNV